jgi:hypothetical protein
MPLTIKRHRNEFVEVVHVPSGDVLRIQVMRLYAEHAPYGDRPNVRLAFHAPREIFNISRPEARCQAGGDPMPTTLPGPEAA